MSNTNSAAVVSLASVSKGYGSGESRVTALDEVSIAFQPGTFTAVMGPSGSGKSTLLQCAAGLDRVDSGEVRLAGANPARMSESNLTKLRREKVGFIFQAFNLMPSLTARQNVELPLRLAGRAPSRQTVDQALDSVEMLARARHLPSQLSGGQQQRVAIARALLSRPEVIFADEPTGALDPHTAFRVLRLLRETADGATGVIVTHDPQVTRFCDRAVFLYAGRVDTVIAQPEPEGVAARLYALGERATAPEETVNADWSAA